MKNSWKIFLSIISGMFLFLGFQSFQNETTSGKVSDPITSDTLRARRLVLQHDTLFKKDDWIGAIDKLNAAQDIYYQYKLWPDYVHCFIHMAKVADYIDIETRANFIQSAIDTASLYLPPNHLMFALAYRQKGESLTNQKMNDSSIYYLNKALPILEKEKDWENWVYCQMLIGVNNYVLEQFDALDSAFMQMKKRMDEPGVSPGTKVSATEWLGIQAGLNGDSEAGIKYFRQVIDLNINHSPGGDIDTTSLFGQYYQLGNFFFEKGDYRRALEYYSAARNLFLIKGVEDSDLALAFFQVGFMYAKLQQYPEAIKNLKQSLVINESIDDAFLEDFVNAYNILGKCYIEQERYDSAFYYLNQSLTVPTTFNRTSSFGRLGICYKETGQVDQAIQMFNDAIKLNENSKNGFNANWNTHLAECYSIKEDYPAAFKMHQKALSICCPKFSDSLDIHANPDLTNAQYPIYLLQSLHAKARTLATHSADPKALGSAHQTYQLTIQWIDSLKADYVLESSQLTWGKRFKQIYAEGVEVATRLYEQTKDEKYLDQVFAIIEKSKSSLLLDALLSSEGKTLGGVPDSLSQKEKELVQSIAFYEKKLETLKTEQNEKMQLLFEGYLSEANLELANLKEQLQRDFPTFHQLKFERKPLSIEDMQAKLLDEETAFIQYFMYDQYAMVLLISKQKKQLARIDSLPFLLETVADFRGVLMDVKSFEEDPQTAYQDYGFFSSKLYNKLLGSFDHQGYKKLIISPDGLLNAVPFEVLTTQFEAEKEGGNFAKLDYLIRNHQIQYAYSAELLLKNKARQEQLEAGERCLAMAPTYLDDNTVAIRGNLSEIRAGSISNLKGTGLEVQAIAEYFNGDFELSEAATESSFKAKAPNYNLLHLAMHGEADFDNPNFGSLIFTNLDQEEEDDYRLYHYEIATMKLQAQLAVLSACETGLGKYEEGEGVFSLGPKFYVCRCA